MFLIIFSLDLTLGGPTDIAPLHQSYYPNMDVKFAKFSV